MVGLKLRPNRYLVVSQERICLNKTIRENITLISEKKNNFQQRLKIDRLELALEISCLKEDFEEDYLTAEDRRDILSLDYIVKSSGNISGGQKSRLELARAIYHLKPGNILVLDSVFSCLDYCLRRRIVDNLNIMLLGSTAFKNCSILLIENLTDVLEELSDSTYYMDEQHRLEPVDKDCLIRFLSSTSLAVNTNTAQSKTVTEKKDESEKKSSSEVAKKNETLKTASDAIDLKIDVTKELKPLETLWRYIKSTYTAPSFALWIANLLLISYARS